MASGNRFTIVISDVPDDCESVKNVVISDELLNFLKESPICGRSDYSDLPGAKKNAGSTWRSFNLYPRRETVTTSRLHPSSLRQTVEIRERSEAARQRRQERKEKINLQKEKRRQRVKAKQRERHRHEQLLRELKELGVPDLWDKDVSYSGIIISSPVKKPSPRRIQERKGVTEKIKIRKCLNFKQGISETGRKSLKDIRSQEKNHQVSCSTPRTKDFLENDVSYQRSSKQCSDGINKKKPPPENYSKSSTIENRSSVSTSHSSGDSEDGGQEEAISSSSEVHTLSKPAVSEVSANLSQDTDGENGASVVSTTVIATADSSTPKATSQSRPRRAKRVNYCELLEYDADLDMLPFKKKKSACINASASTESSAKQSKGMKKHKKEGPLSAKAKQNETVKSKECLVASDQVSSSINEEDLELNSKSKDLIADFHGLNAAAEFLESIFSSHHSTNITPSQSRVHTSSSSNAFSHADESAKINSDDFSTSMPSNSHLQDNSNSTTTVSALISSDSHHSYSLESLQTARNENCSNMLGLTSKGHQQPFLAPARDFNSGTSYGAALQSQGQHLLSKSSVSQQQQMGYDNAAFEVWQSPEMHSHYSSTRNTDFFSATAIPTEVQSALSVSASSEEFLNSMASSSKLVTALSAPSKYCGQSVSSLTNESGKSKVGEKRSLQSESLSRPLDFSTNSFSSGSAITPSDFHENLICGLSSSSSSFQNSPHVGLLARSHRKPDATFIPHNPPPAEDDEVQQLIHSIKMAVQEKEKEENLTCQKKGNRVVKNRNQTTAAEKGQCERTDSGNFQHSVNTHVPKKQMNQGSTSGMRNRSLLNSSAAQNSTSKLPERTSLSVTSVITTEALISHQNSNLPRHIPIALVQNPIIGTGLVRVQSNSLPLQDTHQPRETGCSSNSVNLTLPRVVDPLGFMNQVIDAPQFNIQPQPTNFHVPQHNVLPPTPLTGHLQQNFPLSINSQVHQTFLRPVNPQFTSPVHELSSSSSYLQKSNDVNLPLPLANQEQSTAVFTHSRIPALNVIQTGSGKRPPASHSSSAGATVSCSVNSSPHWNLVSIDQQRISQLQPNSLWRRILEPRQPQCSYSSRHPLVNHQMQNKNFAAQTLCGSSGSLQPHFSAPSERAGRLEQVREERNPQKRPSVVVRKKVPSDTGASQKRQSGRMEVKIHSPPTSQVHVVSFSDVNGAKSSVSDNSACVVSRSQTSINKKRSQDLVEEMLMSSMRIKNPSTKSRTDDHMAATPNSHANKEINSSHLKAQHRQTSSSCSSREAPPVAASSGVKTLVTQTKVHHEPSSPSRTGHHPQEMSRCDVYDRPHHFPAHSRASGGSEHLTREAPGSVSYPSALSNTIVGIHHLTPNVDTVIRHPPLGAGRETRYPFQYSESVTGSHNGAASATLWANHSAEGRSERTHQVQPIVGIHHSTPRTAEKTCVSSQGKSYLGAQLSTSNGKLNSTPLVPGNVHRPPLNVSAVVGIGHSGHDILSHNPSSDRPPQENMHRPLFSGTDVRNQTATFNDRSALKQSTFLNGNTFVADKSRGHGQKQYPPQNPAVKLSQADVTANDRNIFENFIGNGNQFGPLESSENEPISKSDFVPTLKSSNEQVSMTNSRRDAPCHTPNRIKQAVSKSVSLPSGTGSSLQVEDSVRDDHLSEGQPSDLSCRTGMQGERCKREGASNDSSEQSSDKKGFVNILPGGENSARAFTSKGAGTESSTVPTVAEIAPSEAPVSGPETSRTQQSPSAAGVSAIENAPRDKEVHLVCPGGISLTDKQVEYIRNRVASRQEKEAKDAVRLNRIKVKQEAMECVSVEGNDNEDAMSTTSSETSHASHTSPKKCPTALSYAGKAVKLEKGVPALSSLLKASSSSTNLSPDKSIMTALSYIGSWSKEEVSEWLKKNQLEKICLNLNSLDGRGLQRMAFEYFRHPDHFYARVKKSLGLSVFQTLVIGRSLKALVGDQDH